MTLYSKNGSIPYPTKDETEGWVEVEEAPVAPEGKEVVWWSPPGWVIRDPMPVKEGFKYSWSQSEGKWNEYEIVVQAVEVQPQDVVELVDVPRIVLFAGVRQARGLWCDQRSGSEERCCHG